MRADDDTEEPGERRWGWLLLLGTSLILFVAGTFLAYDRPVSGLELSVFHAINGLPEGLKWFFFAATLAPQSIWIGLASVLVTFLLKMYRITWQLASAVVVAYGLGYLAKELIGRARPAELVADAHVRMHEATMGFPSGHTMIITIIALVLWPHLSRPWQWVLVALIPLMALSRIYLGAHLPLDVVGGFALGAIVVAAMRVLPERARSWLKFD